jgi:hypothetical protein
MGFLPIVLIAKVGALATERSNQDACCEPYKVSTLS